MEIKKSFFHINKQCGRFAHFTGWCKFPRFVMKKLHKFRFRAPLRLGFCAVITFLTACASKPAQQSAGMAVKYGTVSNLENVKVRVSLSNRTVYVYENEEPRFVAAVAIGTASNPTPIGNFKALNKLPRKRSNTYGFWVKGSEIVPLSLIHI